MKKLQISLFLMFATGLCAQTAVYKTGDLLARIKPADTTYIVNFWATWCKPCVQEMPALDSLHIKAANTRIKVLLVSLDFREDLENRVEPFLRSKKVKAECVLLDENNGNDFIDKINRNWSGAIPATLVKKGDKVLFAEKKLTLSDLRDMIEKLNNP